MQRASHQLWHTRRFPWRMAVQQRSRPRARRTALVLASLFVLLVVVGVIALPRFIAFPVVSSANQLAQTAMFGSDAQHTHANPAEHILTPKTVSHLTTDWTSFPTEGSLL